MLTSAIDLRRQIYTVPRIITISVLQPLHCHILSTSCSAILLFYYIVIFRASSSLSFANITLWLSISFSYSSLTSQSGFLPISAGLRPSLSSSVDQGLQGTKLMTLSTPSKMSLNPLAGPVIYHVPDSPNMLLS